MALIGLSSLWKWSEWLLPQWMKKREEMKLIAGRKGPPALSAATINNSITNWVNELIDFALACRAAVAAWCAIPFIPPATGNAIKNQINEIDVDLLIGLLLSSFHFIHCWLPSSFIDFIVGFWFGSLLLAEPLALLAPITHQSKTNQNQHSSIAEAPALCWNFILQFQTPLGAAVPVNSFFISSFSSLGRAEKKRNKESWMGGGMFDCSSHATSSIKFIHKFINCKDYVAYRLTNRTYLLL